MRQEVGHKISILVKLRRQFGNEVPIEEFEGAGTPMEMGDYIGVPLYRGWKLVKISLWRRDNFYAGARKVVEATLPRSAGKRVHSYAVMWVIWMFALA